MRKITIKRINLTQRDMTKLIHIQKELSSYKPSFIKYSQPKILEFLNVRNMEALHLKSAFIKELYIKKADETRALLRENPMILPFFNPWDYAIDLITYAQIHFALLKYLHSSNGNNKKILHLGSNYGPYIHFLKHKYKWAALGADKNIVAAKYASEGKLEFATASARKTPFRKNYFNAVISRNFLDISYLQLFYHTYAPRFIERTIQEIHRILKPGGVYISQLEGLEYFKPYLHLFKAFYQINTPNGYLYDSVNILQK